MIHILNFSYDGILGVSTLHHAKASLSLSSDSEAHASGFFKGGANLAGVLTVQGQLDEKKATDMKDSWKRAFSPSTGEANGIAILQGNMDFKPITINPVDAQLLETRKFNVIDICRFFGVSPIKCFDLSSANYSTVEATQLAFLTDTLAPLLEKIEQEFERKLFAPDEEAVINFEESALLRTDKSSQADYYAKLIQIGVMTPAEVRKQLGLSYRDGSDILITQVNQTTLDKISDPESSDN